jgi:Na+-transporting NADH:ubiquinone oxidoreductase subunit F
MSQTILMFITSSIGVFWGVIILMVILLLIAKRWLTPSGNVKITVNGQKEISTPQGGTLLSTLASQGVYLSSACGGKGSCGQCKCRVTSGGGEAIDVEKAHFTRRELLDHYRLGCQVKVKGDMEVEVPQSVLGVKKYECTVISNKNVASFIKEFIVALPEGEHMDFIPGSYAQIEIPAYSLTTTRISTRKASGVICRRGRSSAFSR